MQYLQLPYTLSHPLEQFSRQKNEGVWSKAMSYALDFFEISVQYLTIVLVGVLREQESASANANLQFVVNRIDQKRPLSFGDWANDLFPRAVQAARELLPEHPLTLSLGTVSNKKRNLLLGGKKETSIVQIRNEYKGHSTVLAESIYQGVIEELEPRLEELVVALQPLALWHEQAGEGSFVLVGEAGKPVADLYPAVHQTKDGFIYVFQSLKEEEISFISANENAVTNITDSLNPQFDRWMQRIVPSFDIAKDKNWDELCQEMSLYSSEYLNHMYSEKKYNKELFVERAALAGLFSRFLSSDKRLLPLPGEAGQGKTTQLCHWTEQLLQSGTGVLTFSSTEFASASLETLLRQIFSLGYKKNINAFLHILNDKAALAGKHIVLLFDALNEVLVYPSAAEGQTGPQAVYQDIYNLLGQAGLTQFRVLFTCRNYTWQNELRPMQKYQDETLFFQASDEELEVRSFTDDEVERAYAIYHELYQMETPYADLSRQNIIRIKNPLILKMVCTNYLGQLLPADNAQYTSVALFDKMTTDISHSYAGNRQAAILRETAEVMLSDYEHGVAVDSLILEEVRQARFDASHRLHAVANLIYNDKGTTIAFQELLNKPERPILRLIKDEKIQFIYERFLEYMLALAYYRRHSKGLAAGQPIPASVYVATLSSAAANEVFMSTLRNVIIIDYLRTRDAGPLLDLAGNYSDNYMVLSLVSDVMNTLVTENYENELFEVLRTFITFTNAELSGSISEFNAVNKVIEKNKADNSTIARHKVLMTQLAPLMSVRKLATSTLVNGVLFTDYHNESLYHTDPYDLLWLLMDDPVTEVRDNACLLVYYASNKTHTQTYTPLRENITVQTVKRMYDFINRTPVVALANGKKRKRVVTFLETGTRINVLLVIDTVLHINTTGIEVADIFSDITRVAKHLTGNFFFIRLLMPFIQLVMRRQVLFQSDYVNNVIEYQTFWEDNVIPDKADDGQWCRQDLSRMADFAYLCSVPQLTDAAKFRQFVPAVISAYQTGDSLSYFALERLLIIAGIANMENVRPVMQSLYDGSNRNSEWFDYSQMSFIYVLYQLGLKTETLDPFVWQMLGEWCEDWTLRCRGWFKGRNSHKANPRQLYKRNVMTWYAMTYCVRYGDRRDPTEASVPIFRKLIRQAVEWRDKELLVHLINNISELVADSGYIHTSLDLLYVLMRDIPDNKTLQEFERNVNTRYADTQESLITLIGKILGTAKNYFPQEVNSFLTKDLKSLTFPGISQYKDEILGYNPGGERLSDLFTHKFGNALIYTLVHEAAIDQVFSDALKATAKADNSFRWFDSVVRIVINKMFNLKL